MASYFNPMAQLMRNPLGSGLYDPSLDAPGPRAPFAGGFPLGSGLFGQQVGPQSIQPGAGPRPQAGAAGGGFADNFAQLLANPAFQFGVGLLGGAHTTNPYGGALDTAMRGIAAQNAQRLAQAQLANESRRTDISQQVAGQGQQKINQEIAQWQQGAPQREATLGVTQAQVPLLGAQTNAELAKPAQMAAQTGLMGAQTGEAQAMTARAGAQTQMEKQQMALVYAQYQRQQAILNAAGGALGISASPSAPLGGPQVAPQPPAPQAAPGGAAPDQGAPQAPPGAAPSVPQAAPQLPPQGALPQAAPQGGLQPSSLGAAAGSGGVGKYGTPSVVLDNLMHVESGGNPNAVNPQTGATGAYQFLPSTVAMLGQQGLKFDPRDPVASRDMADAYIQMLQRKTGSLPGALAAFGGFKSHDPTAYVNKIMTGLNSAPGGQPSNTQMAGGLDPLSIAKFGALAGLAGVPGSQGMIDLAKLAQPQPAAAGSYLRDPQTGGMTFLPNPYESARTTNETARTGSELEKVATERAKAQAGDTMAMRGVTQSLNRMTATVDSILKSPGLPINTGYAGSLGAAHLTQAGRDTNAQLESLKAQSMLEVINNLKSMSKNGSTGFGQLSDQEGEVARTYLANLSKAQSLPAMQAALGDLKTFAQQTLAAHQEMYNSLYGQGGPAVSALGPSSPLTALPQAAPAASAGAPQAAPALAPPKVGAVQAGFVYMGGDPSQQQNWKPLPKAGSVQVSPREAVGVIH